MALYEVTGSGLQRRPPAGFAALQIYERRDLQRLLLEQISALGEDLLIVAEEFGTWEDARRRIDLLAIDKDGRLVVIEIKRTEDGGHMELQAIRYAAMVSSMGFTEVLDAYTAHCRKYRMQENVDPGSELRTFLESAEGDEDPVISTDVRIMLVSANFGREITTAVLWLNGFEGMDIRCIRLVPYELEEKVLVDIQQVIPLPEAADYQVKLRKKDAARERALHGGGRDLTRYHIIVDGEESPDRDKRNSMCAMVEQLVGRGASLRKIQEIIPNRMRVVDGKYPEQDALESVLLHEDSSFDPSKWFTQVPFVDENADKTYVLSKRWGPKTGARLKELSEAFPETKVTFREADPETT